MFLFYALSFTALTFAVKKLDLSVVYAIWSGVGMVIIGVISYYLFDETFTAAKIFFIGLIVVGVLGLKLSY